MQHTTSLNKNGVYQWQLDGTNTNVLGGGTFRLTSDGGTTITLTSINVASFHQHAWTVNFVEAENDPVQSRSYWLNSNDTCSDSNFYPFIDSVTVSVVQPLPPSHRPH